MASEKRLIDANAAIERAKESDKIVGSSIWETGEVVEFLDDCPTVDAVEVVHGRWIDNIDENGYLCNAWRKCSACGGLNYSKRPPYCPNCGAKMDGDGNG